MRELQGEVFYKLSESEYHEIDGLLTQAHDYLVDGEEYSDKALEKLKTAIRILRG